MSAPVANPVTRRRPRSWRWVRAVAPFAVLAVLYAVTIVAHLVEEPDLRDPGTLSPTGTGPDGSSRLAALLEARGVRIERVDSANRAISVVGLRDAAVFVPTPDFLNPFFAERLASQPGRHRVVVVEPGLRTTFIWSPRIIGRYPTRWATATVAPECADPLASQAGPAAVRHTRYAVGTPNRDCYGGGLVSVGPPDGEIVVVGASDPFRNRRIDEHGNAALAVGLLAGFSRVVWVDVHAPEPFSSPPIDVSLPEYHRPESDRGGGGGPSIWDAFPPALWASLVLAVAVAVLLAFVRGRRLAPPVSEPLPVLVPAAETVTGRGRLYQRIKARGATLETLRAAAIARLAAVVVPTGAVGPQPTAEQLVARVAQRVGWPEPDVHDILFGPEPDGDDKLELAVARLDALVQVAVHERPLTTEQGSVHRGGAP